MRFFCVPSFFPRIHFQIHEAFAQLRDSDISVLQSGLLRIDRLSLPDFSSRRFLFLSNESGFRTAFPHGSCRARFRSMSAQALRRREPPSYTGSVRSCKRPSLSAQIPAFPEWQLSKEDLPVRRRHFPASVCIEGGGSDSRSAGGKIHFL